MALNRDVASGLASLAFRTVVAFALVAIAAPASAQTAVADFSAAPPSGDYTFRSTSPATLAELIDAATPRPAVAVLGHLFLPAGDAKVPALVFIHGSGGVYPAMLDFWPKTLNAAGIAVFAVDTFGSRGVRSTVDDQSAVPFAADTADAFNALKLLATHPRIDPNRIAIIGASRGGISALRTAVERVVAGQHLPNDLHYAAHVMLYSGGCTGIFRLVVRPGVFRKEPMLWLHGDADDYAPMPPCQDYSARIAAAGTPTEFVVIPGARHKFDSDDTKRYTLRTAQRTNASCPLETDIATFAIDDMRTGKRLSRDEIRDVSKESCSELGASVEGDRKARSLAAENLVRFLGQALKP
jgi:dienelactone hydrolase